MNQDRLAAQIFNFLALGTAAMLVAAAALVWLPSGSDGPARVADAGGSDIDPFAVFETDIARYAAPISERPVFQMTRRPPVVEVVEEAPPPELTLTLVGILDSEISKIALFRLSNREDIIRMREGQVIADFRILEITDAQVTVENAAGEKQEMRLGN